MRRIDPGRRVRRAWIVAGLLLAALAPHGARAQETMAPEQAVRAVLDGGDLAAIARILAAGPDDAAGPLNAVRLGLKAAGQAAKAHDLLAAVVDAHASDAALYNLSLTNVDRLIGHNLLEKGYLSSASIRTVDRILKQRPDDWLALHIRGLNNLYWPDWFDRAPTALRDLQHAVAVAKPLLRARADEDGVASTYLALGDAYALTDQPAEARAAWRDGQRLFPDYAAFAERLAVVDDAALHAAARAARDSDKPIDTDLARLRAATGAPHAITIVTGTLFGPGPLPDQTLKPGGLADLRLARPLTGGIAPFNDGAAEPHLPGEIAVGKKLDGLLSDGTPANKHVDVGHVFLMNGRMKLFLAAVQDGPNHGMVHFYLDRYWNWTIQDDIGIDPGFPAGVIKFTNFFFSTSPRLLPLSTQTQASQPAGVDRAGSLASGAWVEGLLGDDDGAGHLSGTFNAIGSFPLDSVFLPGAPFAQTRVFRTDIALAPELAGFLTLANAYSHLRAAEAMARSGAGEADPPEALIAAWRERLAVAGRQFARAPDWTRALDAEARAAFDRLTAAGDGALTAEARRARVCGGERDLGLLADRLGLVNRDTDGSRLAEMVKCPT